MPVDWLAIWGVCNAVGFVFKPILEELTKEFAKDTAKDYFKSCLGSFLSSFHQEPLQKAIGKAVYQLLQLFQDELLDRGYTDEELKDWIADVDKFIHTPGVQKAIQGAFMESGTVVDRNSFAQSWHGLQTTHALPEDFPWNRIATRFTRYIRNLREEDKGLRDVLSSQALAETAESLRQNFPISPGFNLETYREALLERYANVHFDPIDTTGACYNNVKLWNIFVPQTVRECQEYSPQLLELPKEHFRRMRQRNELEDVEIEGAEELIQERRHSYLDQSPLPVIQMIDDSRINKLVVLGDPGSGKTSLMRYVALRWAKIEDNTLLYSHPLPLLVELREYDRWNCDDGKSFVRYLHSARTWHQLNQMDVDQLFRKDDAAVLMLDGLDEVFDPVRRGLIINDIQRFSNEYPQARVVVTSRVIGYKPSRLSDAGFHHFMLQDLDDDQINDFLDRWHNVTFENEQDKQLKRNRLSMAIEGSKAIRELAGNPLLLTMMAILNRNQELPRDRVHLYQQASRVLLHEWDMDRALESHPQLKGLTRSYSGLTLRVGGDL